MNGIFFLNNSRFLQVYNEKHAETAATAAKSTGNRCKRLIKKISGVKTLWNKYRHKSMHIFTTLNKMAYGMYLPYNKQSTKDGKIFTNVDARCWNYIEWISCSFPNHIALCPKL